MNPLNYAQQQGYMGKSIPDPIGQYVGECVSWFKDYFVYRGVPYADLFVPGGAAKNLWLETTPALLKWFDKVDSPQIGDAAVYDGNFGDVALVCDGGVVGQMNLNPSGSPNLVPMATRSLGSPMGYLRLKGENMGEIIDTNASRIISNGILARNGIRGRAYSLDGSAGDPWIGAELTLQFLTDIFNSPEAQQWRDSEDPDSVKGINAQLDSIPALKQQIADLQAQLAAKPGTPTILKPGTYQVN